MYTIFYQSNDNDYQFHSTVNSVIELDKICQRFFEKNSHSHLDPFKYVYRQYTPIHVSILIRIKIYTDTTTILLLYRNMHIIHIT